MNLDDQLLRDLEGLRTATRFAPTPDFASRIADSLPPRAGRASWQGHPSGGRLSPLAAFVVIVLLLMLAVVATLAIPPARESVARWLHIDLPGIRIERVHDGADTERSLPSSLGGSLLLGTPVLLEGANHLLTSPLLAPSTTLVGEPMEIWQRNGGEVVTLLYPPSAGLPEIGDTGVGLLLMRIQPTGDGIALLKKSFGQGTIEQTSVLGKDAWWIVHGQLTVLPDEPFSTTTRASGNVLIWTDGDGVTWRLESVLQRDEAVRIAESMVPMASLSGNHGETSVVRGDDGAVVVPVITLFASLLQEVSHAPTRDGRSRRRVVFRYDCAGECRRLGIRGTGRARRRGRGRETR